MKQDEAADLARDALLWLCGRPDDIARFLAQTGLDPNDLRRVATDPEALGSLLDHLLADEALLRLFAQENLIDPALPARARAALPGGSLPHWT